MRTLVLLLIIFIVGPMLQAQTDTSLRAMNEREKELYKLLMDYRSKKWLKSIPISPSLNKVAQCHVRDLNTYPRAKKCNMHSWSKNGPWKPVCYTDNHKGADLAHIKPSELSSYTGEGFEIAYWNSSSDFTAKNALDGWKSSYGHNSMIINLGMWKKSKWRAIGIAVEGNYAVVWFGKETDPAGEIIIK